MKIKELSGNSLSFLGDAIYTLKVREYFLEHNHQSPKKLQHLTSLYNSASGQMKAFNYLKDKNYFNKEELDIFKRGRNDIHHIPKNGDLLSYEIASGLEAIVGYLYIVDKERMDDLFIQIFNGGLENE